MQNLSTQDVLITHELIHLPEVTDRDRTEELLDLHYDYMVCAFDLMGE